MPSVLFVDEDQEALNRVLLHIEPIFITSSLRSAGPLSQYIDHYRPEVICLSDRLQYRKKDAKAIVAELHETYRGSILVLTECVDERDRAAWRERGASDCFLHPARFEPRLDALTRRILDVAATRMAREPEGFG